MEVSVAAKCLTDSPHVVDYLIENEDANNGVQRCWRIEGKLIHAMIIGALWRDSSG